MTPRKRPTLAQIEALDLQDVMKLTEKDLRAYVGSLRDVVNKRYKRVKEAYGSTPETKVFEQYGGALQTKGKTRNQLLSEMRRGLNYIHSKTGSVTGRKAVIKELKQKLGASETEDWVSDPGFWDFYRELENDPDAQAMIRSGGKGGSPPFIQIAKEIYIENHGRMSKHEMIELAKRRFEKEYRQIDDLLSDIDKDVWGNFMS